VRDLRIVIVAVIAVRTAAAEAIVVDVLACTCRRIPAGGL
jgi:hypothetical protein